MTRTDASHTVQLAASHSLFTLLSNVKVCRHFLPAGKFALIITRLRLLFQRITLWFCGSVLSLFVRLSQKWSNLLQMKTKMF